MAFNKYRIQAGAFRQRITILQPTTSGTVRSFTPLTTVWGEVEPKSAVDRPVGLEPPDIVTSQVRIRFIKGIRPRMRLQLKGGRTLEIVAVINGFERNKVLFLSTREVTS